MNVCHWTYTWLLFESCTDSLKNSLWLKNSSISSVVYDNWWVEICSVILPVYSFLIKECVERWALLSFVLISSKSFINALVCFIPIQTKIFMSRSWAIFIDVITAHAMSSFNVFPKQLSIVLLFHWLVVNTWLSNVLKNDLLSAHFDLLMIDCTVLSISIAFFLLEGIFTIRTIESNIMRSHKSIFTKNFVVFLKV